MKNFLLLLSVFSLLFSYPKLHAQEAGFGVGTSNYFGDLGRQGTTNNYISDLWIEETRPSFTAFYRHHFNHRVAIKGTLSLGFIGANDALVEYERVGDSEWFRHYRNLHFKSHVLELAVMAEVNALPFKPGSMRDRFTPYFTTGLALFHFDPKAEYNGEWVRLQPLGTEGQGTQEYPDRRKYSLIQPSIPVGFGIKYNVSRRTTINFEIAHRFTFTDYLDDVSNTYASKDAFFNNHDPETAQMIWELSVRSHEHDVEGVHRNVTRPGQQRGNPQGNDAYVFTTLSVSYYFGRLENEFAHHNRLRRYRLRW